MDKVARSGTMDLITRVIGTTESFTVTVNKLGLTRESMLANGIKVIITVKVSSPGQMAVNTLEISKTTRNMDMEYILGREVSNMLECGNLENSMEKVF